MAMKRFSQSAFLAAAIAAFAAASSAHAQAYPAKPIRLSVPFVAGGIGVDYVARLLSPKIAEALGQPVVIENRPGANGMIGSEMVARAAPDGYTLLFTTPSTHITSVFLMKKLPFDPVKDFTPITATVEPATCIVVHTSVPARSVKELVEYAKRNPGKLSYGSPGIGSVYHLTAELFKQAADVDILHVPYKGAPQAVSDAAAGQIQVSFTTVANAMPHVRGGNLRILAVLEGSRYASLPDVPTVGETVPGFEKPASWFAFFGPAALPQPILGRLHGEIIKAMNAPDVKAKFDEAAFAVIGNTPAEFAAMLKRNFEVYGRAAKAAGVKPE
jgi:tripartite-type tricarboxylate transporter receptor subunit TctC